jgi:hypothetical protein
LIVATNAVGAEMIAVLETLAAELMSDVNLSNALTVVMAVGLIGTIIDERSDVMDAVRSGVLSAEGNPAKNGGRSAVASAETIVERSPALNAKMIADRILALNGEMRHAASAETSDVMVVTRSDEKSVVVMKPKGSAFETIEQQ